MEIQVAMPPGGAQPPPAPTAPWVCERCTLENIAGASVCAACDAAAPASARPPPQPARPPPQPAAAPVPSAAAEAEAAAHEEYELALALAESAKLAGLPPPPGAQVAQPLNERSGPDATDRMLSMAQTSQAVEQHSALRVAGDARGTASTLVGLTPEEELELATLKSKYNQFDEPPPPPRPPHFPQQPPPSAAVDPNAPISMSSVNAPLSLPSMPSRLSTGARACRGTGMSTTSAAAARSAAAENGGYAAFADNDPSVAPLSLHSLPTAQAVPVAAGAATSAAASIAPLSMSSMSLSAAQSSAGASSAAASAAAAPPPPKPAPKKKGSLGASLLGDYDGLDEITNGPLVTPLSIAGVTPVYVAPVVAPAKRSDDEGWDDADRPLQHHSEASPSAGQRAGGSAIGSGYAQMD